MLISVLGNLINTTDIYRITPITTDEDRHIYHRFTIHFFNQKSMDIELYAQIYNGGDDYVVLYPMDCDPNDLRQYIPHQALTQQQIEQSQQYQTTLQQITNLYNELVKLWSNYQPTIPQLDF